MASEPDWSRLPSDLPPRLRLLVERCLRKDAQRRLRDIGDARIELLEADKPTAGPASTRVNPIARALPWVIATALAVVAVAGWFRTAPSAAPDASVTRLSLSLDPDVPIAFAAGNAGAVSGLGDTPSLAISPDGLTLVYVARTASGTSLHRRSLDQYEATPVPGSEGANGPFFSPDGAWVGFHADQKLKKVALAGGAPVTLVAAAPHGAFWGDRDVIVFSEEQRGVLQSTTAAGSPPESVTTLNVEEADEAHHRPQLLPGGRAVLFVIEASSLETDRLAIQTIGSSERRILVEDASWGRFIEPAPGVGTLLFLRSETVFAAPFDLESEEITGPETPVIQGIRATSAWGVPQLAVSSNGTLVYAPTSVSANDLQLVWVSRNGEEEPISDDIRAYEDLHLSPDGNLVAFTNEDQQAHVWIHDIARGTATGLVSDGESRDPVWTPDGRFVSYGTKRDGAFGLSRRAADGSGAEEELFVNDRPRWVDPVSWSAAGDALVFTRYSPETKDDVWLVPAGDPDGARPIVQSPAEDWGGKVSPDGRWLAYNSNESGRQEVYVRPFPDGERRWQISSDGGRNMAWSPDGTELFYRLGNSMQVARIRTETEFSASRPEVLFEGSYRHSGRDFAVSPDGLKFVMMKPLAAATGTQLNVVTNWFQELSELPVSGN